MRFALSQVLWIIRHTWFVYLRLWSFCNLVVICLCFSDEQQDEVPDQEDVEEEQEDVEEEQEDADN